MRGNTENFWSNLPLLFIICLLGIIAYSNSFYGSFHLDDTSGIIRNFSIRHFNNLGAIWASWPTRFVTYLSIAFNYHIGGLEFFGYHVFNLAVHLTVTLLFYWLLRLTFNTPLLKNTPIAAKAKPLALLASLIFLLHPIQTQAVNYIIQRASLLVSMFYLASLCLYTKARLKLEEKPAPEAQAWKACYVGSVLAAIISMFSKEISITLPLMICFYEFCFFKGKEKLNFKYLIIFLCLIFTIPLTILFTESPSLGAKAGLGEYIKAPSAWHYLLTQSRVMVTYLRLLILPVSQNLDYDYPTITSLFKLPVILSISLLSVILFCAFKLFKNHRLLSFGILWFFITLLPESSVFPLKNVIFEHRLYLPMAGLSLFAVSGLYYLFRPKNFRLLVLILCATALIYLSMTYDRNRIWENEITLWSDVIYKSPKKARPYNNRGVAYLNQGSLNEAISDFNQALRINPKYADAYSNRGLGYAQQGNFTQALADFDQAIQINPDYTNAYRNQGFTYYLKNDFETAIVKFNKAIKINPYYADAYNNRGVIYASQGDVDQALSDFNRAIEINPRYAEAYNNRGRVNAGHGDFSQALLDYSQAIQINPQCVQAYNNRGFVYANKGNLSQAMSDFNKAIEIDPECAAAYGNRAAAYFYKKDYEQSWMNIHQAQKLGYKASPDFIEQLKKFSGRNK